MKLKGAQIIFECLLEQNADTVFGYPGGSVLDLYDALYDYRDRIRHIESVHEQGACHAADGYARASGKTGVVFATSGPGATNLVTGIANAYMDSVPLVAITGNVSLPLLGRDSFQEVDITGITMPITKQNYIVRDVRKLAEIIREAFFLAQDGRKGPVLIDIPKNVFSETAEFRSEKPREPRKRVYDPEKISAAVTLINEAKKPLIFIGGGINSANAAGELDLFAHKIDAPVCCSLMAVDAMDHHNPLNLGLVGMHGHVKSNVAMKECDLLLAVGTRFSDRVATNRSAFAPKAKIIHIDIDNAEIDKNITTSLPILGDCKHILETLIKLVKPAKRSAWQSEIASFDEKCKIHRPAYSLDPFKILKAVSENSPEDQIIVTDVGQHQMWTAQSYPFHKPHTFLTSGGLGTMGYGMGAAIGAAAATGKRIILITGDGSFHMNLNETATAVRNRLPIVVIVMNNHALGMVRQWQKLFYRSRFSETDTNFHTDYVKLAEAFGAKGFRIDRNEEIQDVIARALQTESPVIIDAELSEDENVLPMIPAGKGVDEIIGKIDAPSK